MATHFLSTLTEPPDGFEFKVPTKSDLLRGTLVLLVRDETEGDGLLEGLWDRFCGVLVISGEEPALEKPGRMAWKLRVEHRMLRYLRPLLQGFAEAIAMGKDALDKKAVWQKEVARLNLDHSAVREHYNLLMERLRSNVEQISDLNASLNEQLEQIRKAEQMKEDLTAMLSHDMRNPILAIDKTLELLSTERLGLINENQKKILKLAINTNDQLGSMVSAFLDIFRDVNGRFDLNRRLYDINQVVTQCIEEISLVAVDKKLEITFQPQIPVMELCCDLFRIKRTIANLLSNAINYSVTDGKIFIGTRLAKGENEEFFSRIPSGLRGRIAKNLEYFWATIEDNGYGIPEEYHEAVFEKFFTVKTDAGLGRRGIGLGLAFCKLVVEAHKGLIFCRTPEGSDVNHRTPGVEFHVILPYRE